MKNIRRGTVVMFWAKVVEKKIPYVCKEGTVKLDGQLGAENRLYDQSWNIGKKPIAYYENDGEYVKCISPCTSVKSGELYLTSPSLMVALRMGYILRRGCTFWLTDQLPLGQQPTPSIRTLRLFRMNSWPFWPLLTLLKCRLTKLTVPDHANTFLLLYKLPHFSGGATSARHPMGSIVLSVRPLAIECIRLGAHIVQLPGSERFVFLSRHPRNLHRWK
ncbi:hypothetical protein DPEC_G00352720 [Dallia pectoralis]|uniref:Uncharacterized protein n=1 Tax=Dallia pectoralis TaxID=75939 RepID=A0ACC2F2D6_DALPE|nr:hypothetical protein DPEC_G00352720 [Dallia pectoralis]